MRWGVLALSVLILLLLSTAASAYKESTPVKIEDDYFYEYDPKVIEGKDITNEEGNCIEIKESEWVIIRDNRIHDCQPSGPTASDGYAIYIEDVEHLIIEGNSLEDNHRGVYLENVKHITIRGNNQTGTYRDAVFKITDGQDIKIYGNLIEDNGADEVLLPATPENIGKPDGRLQGIVLWTTDDAKIYDNIIINSSSDGIGIAGSTREDPAARSHNFTIYGNTIFTNGEQGIWLEGAQDGEIYDNHIARNKARPGFGGGSSGIMLQYDVRNFKIHDNQIEKNDACGVMIQNSPDNFIYSNRILSNKLGGVCLDGETISLPEYTLVENRHNKIHRNIFKNNIPPVRIMSGRNFGTEFFYNNFDVYKDNMIQTKTVKWVEDLVINDNEFREEKTEETVKTEEAEDISPEEPAGDAGSEPAEPEEERNDEGDGILLAYGMLTLFFVILVVLVILFSVRKKSERKTKK